MLGRSWRWGLNDTGRAEVVDLRAILVLNFIGLGIAWAPYEKTFPPSQEEGEGKRGAERPGRAVPLSRRPWAKEVPGGRGYLAPDLAAAAIVGVGGAATWQRGTGVSAAVVGFHAAEAPVVNARLAWFWDEPCAVRDGFPPAMMEWPSSEIRSAKDGGVLAGGKHFGEPCGRGPLGFRLIEESPWDGSS